MAERVRAWLLQTLRVPDAPAPPPGDPTLLQTFRASPNFFRYSVAMWALKQLSALAGLVFSYFFFRSAIMRGGFVGYATIFEQLALVAFVAQLPFSFALLRLSFEMRWYILSDRSLRIRDGILTVREQTMTFANIQNIAIRQNPLQRMFGIATVVVRAAGGGGSTSSQGGSGAKAGSHEATFEGVDNADQIRAAIRDRIRLHRDAGLGDPDEVPPAPAAAVPADAPTPAATAPAPVPSHGTGGLRPAVAAAQRIAAEAAALRALVSPRPT